MSLDKAYNILKEYIEYKPIVKWYIQCYHYKETHHTRFDKKGKRYTETETERINTHSAFGHFEFEEWHDFSDKIDILFFLGRVSAVRLNIIQDFRYSCVAAQRMNSEK